LTKETFSFVYRMQFRDVVSPNNLHIFLVKFLPNEVMYSLKGKTYILSYKEFLETLPDFLKKYLKV
jgi:hypothetical protein